MRIGYQIHGSPAVASRWWWSLFSIPNPSSRVSLSNRWYHYAMWHHQR